jgi:hypothetical protein
MDAERGLPEDVDPALWFECALHPGAKDYLVATPWHTFPGRMSAWCETRGVGFRVSKSELPEDLPPATRYWVQGFLTGNLPRQPDVDDEDDPAIAEWRGLAERFLETGVWPPAAGSDLQRQWLDDAVTLAEIGRAVGNVVMPDVELRLPRDLAEAAAAAWRRDDQDGPRYESPEQRGWRHDASVLALVGLAVETRGRTDGDAVVVEVPADLVSAAIRAAEG